MSPGANRSGRGRVDRVYISLGSNIGDRAGRLRLALTALEALLPGLQVSPVYETAPVGLLDQPDFLNCVAAGDSRLAPRALLRAFKHIEREIGRRAGGPRFGPRVIDLDLLLYGDRVLSLPARPGWPALTLPHPSLHERAFVLVPLADLAPGLRHPLLGASMATLAEQADRSGVWPAGPVLETWQRLT
ncbi:MAG: 2-amino-4-hydroxy-6-hydroxymethyldihydropteridine diphosphokinase [Chloroflexi bacterium]|nr:2-amino-4-hydroxy-6-hydroxymethyldihydropteridine diphosphokinase [Chloroflexota bacterium]